ncbi:2OG-Fe(II) oxygenase [Pendulispora brunnea]|uniref:2OG-Fe(II) oxygenase n=1 Tax=Pendulispora brunnea TaxID=2905690 RepID=A0ABZ2KQ11_9BACT
MLDDAAAAPVATQRSPLRDFLDRTVATATERPDLLGQRGSAWRFASVTPWVYPAGTGLSLHYDGGNYTGAFTYFLHRTWNVQWGGLLLVLDAERRPSKGPGEERPVAWLDDDVESNEILERGLAQCILPKPNRIVFLAGGTPHMVTRVDPNAGQIVRVSLAGFFGTEMTVKVTPTSCLGRVSEVHRGPFAASIEGGRAVLKAGEGDAAEILIRTDPWGLSALQYIAEREHFAVNEIPGSLNDEERLAMASALLRVKAYKVEVR